MKKLISILLMLALVLSFCACGKPAEPTEPTEPAPSTEATEATQATQPEMVNGVIKPDLSGIDEFTPNSKGVYQICTKEGFKNIANHPDAEFELLWHIDMEGETWTPVGTKDAPFTGQINGGQFTVSNFVIDTPTADGDMGLFGVIEGQVKDLFIANVTMTTTADTKRAGIWAGHNTVDGQFLRCGVENSTMTVAEVADNAAVGSIVGVNEGEFRNGTMDVDMTVTAAGKADIGGICGYAADGNIQFVKNAGIIDVTGGTNKNVGLFAGSVTKDAEIKGAVFLGEKNTIDGTLFIDYTGNGDTALVSGCLYRDNVKAEISAEIQEKRDIAEAHMREMGTVVWTVPKTLKFSCYCALDSCAGMFQPGTEIHGIYYNHKGGSMERAMYLMDENNCMEEWAYLGDFDGFDCYMGSDCSTALIQAYWRISADLDFNATQFQIPAYNWGCVAVGDWEWDLETIPTYYDKYLEATGEERMMEAYACLRKGDFIVNRTEDGGHTRMVAADAVVVRNSEGKIDATESYILTHEQGAPRTLEPYYSSWRVDYKYSFASIYVDWYVPCTIEEFVTGEFETPEAHMEGGLDGKAGLTTGTVYSNFFLDSVSMVIEDEAGNIVFDKRMFTTVSRYYDDGNRTDLIIRLNNHEYDMGHFAVPLQECMFELGETYNVTIKAHVGSGDSFVVREFSFTNGTAA